MKLNDLLTEYRNFLRMREKMETRRDTYPFSAIVGQERMKMALLLNAINPRIGGVLIKGEKGTAKSTAARALAGLLPDRRVVTGCRFGCDPDNRTNLCVDCRSRVSELPVSHSRMCVVELPISATEDKVVGSLDIGHALRTGEKKFEPGILAQAHRNILYVDEVNLLNDHLVDVLLDVAAMGMNYIEREGVSYSHPSSFILVGTMNPEEGELRPQLLDRFGLCVDVEGIHDASTRVEVIRRRQRYEESPGEFNRSWEEEEKRLRKQILTAQGFLSLVKVPDEILHMIARICIDMGVDGHRADITLMKTAATLAAFHGRKETTEEDVREAADLVLTHRMRKKPFSEQQMDSKKIDESIRKSREETKQQEEQQTGENPQDNQQTEDRHMPDASATTRFSEGEPFRLNQQMLQQKNRPDPIIREGRGKRSVTESGNGKYVGSRIPGVPGSDIAFDATIRAAAPFQRTRPGKLAVRIEPPDIREKIRERRSGNTILFVVDASGSMGAEQRMTAVKGAILSLLIDAYQKRDRVGLVAFRGTGAEVLLPPTSSVELARKYMQDLPVGGKTPLAHGLSKALDVMQRERKVNRDAILKMILISDGRANVGQISDNPFGDAKTAASHIRDAGIPSCVIDSEQGFISFGLAHSISEEMGAKYLRLEELRAEDIAGIAKGIGM